MVFRGECPQFVYPPLTHPRAAKDNFANCLTGSALRSGNLPSFAGQTLRMGTWSMLNRVDAYRPK
jgi:hypothetical protein